MVLILDYSKKISPNTKGLAKVSEQTVSRKMKLLKNIQTMLKELTKQILKEDGNDASRYYCWLGVGDIADFG